MECRQLDLDINVRRGRACDATIKLIHIWLHTHQCPKEGQRRGGSECGRCGQPVRSATSCIASRSASAPGAPDPESSCRLLASYRRTWGKLAGGHALRCCYRRHRCCYRRHRCCYAYPPFPLSRPSPNPAPQSPGVRANLALRSRGHGGERF